MTDSIPTTSPPNFSKLLSTTTKQKAQKRPPPLLKSSHSSYADLDGALMEIGGKELEGELVRAVNIDGHEGAFRTEFDCTVLGRRQECSTVNLIVTACGGTVKLLWSLKTRSRGDGELQIGVVVSALSAAAAGSDIRIVVLPKGGEVNNTKAASSSSSTENDNSNGNIDDNEADEIATPTWEGVCRPFRSHERQMHEGAGLLVLYPTNASAFSIPDERSGKAHIAFATYVTPLSTVSSGLASWISSPINKSFSIRTPSTVNSSSTSPKSLWQFENYTNSPKSNESEESSSSTAKMSPTSKSVFQFF